MSPSSYGGAALARSRGSQSNNFHHFTSIIIINTVSHSTVCARLRCITRWPDLNRRDVTTMTRALTRDCKNDDDKWSVGLCDIVIL